MRSGRTGLGITVSGLGVIACTYGLARYAYGLFLPVFREQFALSGALSGAIATGGYASYCGAAVAAHRLLGRGHARGAAGLAGSLAALGCTAIAVAPSAGVLAAGVLVAGSGAGLASPAMVALIAQAVPAPGRPRAQAIVNAGTGAGVLVSGPVALLFAHQSRFAWLCFAVFTVLATAGVWAATGRHHPVTASVSTPRTAPALGHLGPALTAAALLGVGSSAIWTFGRELVVNNGHLNTTSSSVFWTLLGAAGLAGALVGDAVQRWDITRTWVPLALLLSVSTVALALYPGDAPVAFLCASVFGATYVALTGVLIAWAATLQPATPAAATATLFIVLTLGQAIGATLIGVLTEATNPRVAFTAAAVLAATSTIPALRPSGGGPTPATAIHPPNEHNEAKQIESAVIDPPAITRPSDSHRKTIHQRDESRADSCRRARCGQGNARGAEFRDPRRHAVQRRGRWGQRGLRQARRTAREGA